MWNQHQGHDHEIQQEHSFQDKDAERVPMQLQPSLILLGRVILWVQIEILIQLQ